MKLPALLKTYAKENGYTMLEDCIYKEIDGFLTTLKLDMQSGGLWLFVSYFADEQKSSFFPVQVFLDESKKPYRFTQYNYSPVSLSILFPINKKGMQQLNDFIPLLTQQLRHNGFTGADTCSHCGKPLGIEKRIAVMGAAVGAIHQNCYYEVSSKFDNDIQAQAFEEKHYGAGAMGALLGGLVAAIPWILVFMWGYISGWLALLIAWGANFGYTKAGGKNGRGKAPILILIVLFCVLLAQFVGYWIQIAIALDGQAISQIPSLLISLILTDSEVAGEYFGNMLMSILFSGFGIWWIFRRVHHENPAKTQRFELLQEEPRQELQSGM